MTQLREEVEALFSALQEDAIAAYDEALLIHHSKLLLAGRTEKTPGQCQFCGLTWEAEQRKKFCSRVCSDAADRKRRRPQVQRVVNCLQCGAVIHRPNHAGRPKKFCCPGCRYKYALDAAVTGS